MGWRQSVAINANAQNRTQLPADKNSKRCEDNQRGSKISPVGGMRGSKTLIISDFSSCRLSCRPAHVTNQELDGSPQSFGEKPKVFQGKKLPLLLVFWIFSEILLFTLILRSIGLLATLALALATSLLGLSNLRKLFKIQRKTKS